MGLAAVVAVLLFVAFAATRELSSHDLGFHLRAGRSMLEGQGWPRFDTFTYTLSHRPYIDTSWGYQVVVATAERAGGPAAIVLFHVVLAVLTFGVLAREAWRMSGGSAWIAPLLLAGALAAEPRFESRPELVSWLLLALLCGRLRAHRERGASLWPILPLFLLWANAHSLFVLGWGALACFLVAQVFERRWRWSLAGWSLAAVGVSLINPYGWRAPAFALELATRFRADNAFAQIIGEFRSPWSQMLSDQLQFYVPATVGWLFFTVAVLAALPGLLRSRCAFGLSLLAVFLPLSLTMVRNVPLLVVVGLPHAARGLAATRMRWARSGAWGHLSGVAVLVVSAVLSLRVGTDAFYVDARRQQRFGLGWNELVLPVGLAEWASRADPPSRVLNHLGFGGYLMWALDEPVFIDSRLEVVGEEFYATYLAALGSPQGLDGAVRRYDVGWIALPYRLRPDTIAGLSRHPGWRLAYVDALSAAFVKAEAADEGSIDPGAVEAASTIPEEVDLSRLPGFGGRPRDVGFGSWWNGLWKRQSYPEEAFNLGVFHATRGEPRQAAARFAQAIVESDGAHYELYINLGTALAATGRREDAARCLRLALEDLPWYRRQRRERLVEQLHRLDERGSGPGGR